MVKLRLKRCGRKRPIESLQLVFAPEEKAKTCRKWIFMIR
uniref:30S ribosomal protein S16, chloroplastic n=1 Tax=Swertia punicea TaxID=137131 RepID=A0A8F0JX04_9GENT|nr:ribosomal protein S16 [Swertia punicea]